MHHVVLRNGLRGVLRVVMVSEALMGAFGFRCVDWEPQPSPFDEFCRTHTHHFCGHGRSRP